MVERLGLCFLAAVEEAFGFIFKTGECVGGGIDDFDSKAEAAVEEVDDSLRIVRCVFDFDREPVHLAVAVGCQTVFDYLWE